jgi:hypothetical protein
MIYLARVFFILLLSLAPSLAFGATYYIDYSSGADSNNGTSTSTPWQHCPGDSAATGTAHSATFSPGDKVIFKGGQSYSVPSGGYITLSWGGSSGSPIVYDGDSGTYVSRWGSGTSQAVITGNNNAAAIFLAVAGKNYITINNLELRSVTASSESSIINSAQIAANYFTITNCTIHDAGSGANINTAIGFAINASGSNWTVQGNSFYDCYHACIYLNSGFSNNTISNNTFGDKSGWAIALAEGGNSDDDGNSIHNNTFYNIGSYYNLGSPHCNDIIMWVQGSSGASDSGSLTNLSVYNNYFYESSPTTGTGTITLQINDSGGSSSELANNVFIYNNISANEGRNSFCNISASQGNINNLYIYGNSGWTSGGSSAFIQLITNSTGSFNAVYIKNNSWSGNSYIIQTDQLINNPYIDYNNWNTTFGNYFSWKDVGENWSQWQALGFDTHGYGPTSDPKYTNITTSPYNLMPQAGSPLIDHGVTLGSPYNVDYLGTSRPQGSAYDIGAYESVFSALPALQKPCLQSSMLTITASAGTNGSILPLGPVSVCPGNYKTFTITPQSGYTASVGGTCGGSLVGTTYTTNPITAACTVSATFQ